MMLHSLRKNIILALVWVLIIAPIPIAMGSINIFKSIELSIQSKGFGTTHHTIGEHHNEYEVDSTAMQCDQDNGCSSCNSCGHCLTIICRITDLHVAVSRTITVLPSITLYQIDQPTSFRPPRLS